MQKSELTNEELLSLLKENDHQAFEIIYRRYWKSLFRQLYSKCGDITLAEELTQNIFVSLWERRQTLCITHLPAYLDAAARFSFINHLKSNIRAERLADVHQQDEEKRPQQTSLDELATKELSERLEKGLNQLPPKTRKVFVLSRMEYLPVKKIAEMLQLSDKAVEYHITKSLKTLRLVLRDYLSISAFIYCYQCLSDLI